jgi:hypothetical protein
MVNFLHIMIITRLRIYLFSRENEREQRIYGHFLEILTNVFWLNQYNRHDVSSR